MFKDKSNSLYTKYNYLFFSYLDTTAKVQNPLVHSSNLGTYKQIIKSLLHCANTFLETICLDCKSEYFKQLLCNREYCLNPVCQERATKRRKARIWRHFVDLGNKIGYTVFTLPKDVIRFVNQDILRCLRGYVRDKLKRIYGKRFKAIVRWHFFGDGFYKCNYDGKKSVCAYREFNAKLNYPICNNFFVDCKYRKEASIDFFPHLNIVHNVKFIEETELEEIKKGWRDKVNNLFGCDYEKIVVNHEYVTARPQRLHIFNYVFRNTFRVFRGYENIACLLSGFRNSVQWGKFETDKYKIIEKSIDLYGAKNTFEIADDKLIELMQGYCYFCGSKNMRRLKRLSYGIDKSLIYKHLGLGYYYFPCNIYDKTVYYE